jgi:hypothetical protein
MTTDNFPILQLADELQPPETGKQTQVRQYKSCTVRNQPNIQSRTDQWTTLSLTTLWMLES